MKTTYTEAEKKIIMRKIDKATDKMIGIERKHGLYGRAIGLSYYIEDTIRRTASLIRDELS